MKYWEPPIPSIDDGLAPEELEERLNWLEYVGEQDSAGD